MKIVFDLKIKNPELLDKCRQTVKEISEFHAIFMENFSFFEGSVNDGIVPPENMDKELAFLYHYGNGVKKLSELICDYIDSVECIEENSTFASRVVVLDKKFVSDLRERPSFSGSDFSAMEKAMIDSKNAVDYWCKQKWLGGEMAYDLEGSIHTLEERYENLVRLLSRLTECLEAHLSELEMLEADMSMACVYASPEMIHRNERTPSEQTYPSMHSIVVGNDEDDLMMEEIYGSPETIMDYQNKQKRMKDEAKETRNKAAFCMYCGNSVKNGGDFCGVCGKASAPANAADTCQFCPHCGAVNRLASTYCIYCGIEIRKRNTPDTPPIACVYASPEIMVEKREKDGFLKRLFKRK